MMKITGLSRLFKWENLHNWWLTKYFFAPLYIYILFFLVDFLFFMKPESFRFLQFVSLWPHTAVKFVGHFT